MPILPAKIVPGHTPSGRTAPVIVHVPHAKTLISPYIRDQILLDDAELAREIVRLTDWHVDYLFDWTLELGATLFVNQLSRLVFDPERFTDDAREPMAKRGQGVVYTRTTQGEPLAEITPEERAERIAELYEPYHEALDAVVEHQLERFGRCLVLDCHSFATEPLPSELDQSPNRPDICIGTDAVHTPPELAAALERYLAAEGFRVARDTPFAGTLVPNEALEREDHRVTSVMIEVQRGLYCDEATGERSEGFAEVRERLERAVTVAVSEWVGRP